MAAAVMDQQEDQQGSMKPGTSNRGDDRGNEGARKALEEWLSIGPYGEIGILLIQLIHFF